MCETTNSKGIQVIAPSNRDWITLNSTGLTLTTSSITVGGQPIDNRRIKFYKGTPDTGWITYNSVRKYIEHGYLNGYWYPDPDEEIFEAGAGLAEFIPYVVRKLGRRLKHRPVVVDPLDYNLVIKLLQRFIHEGINPEQVPTARELIKRAQIILDPRYVELINLPFLEALDYPAFQRKYDLVIDHFGPWMYSPCSMQVSNILTSLRRQ
jgi:hypothetical protein